MLKSITKIFNDPNFKIFIFQVFITVCLDKATDLILVGEYINVLWPTHSSSDAIKVL